MAAVLLLSGVQLVILGIVGEYLGRLYLTANGKPQSVIREVRRSQSRAPPRHDRRFGYARAQEDDVDLLHESRGGDIARRRRADRAEIGAPRSPTVVAQFLNPLTIIGFGIYSWLRFSTSWL